MRLGPLAVSGLLAAALTAYVWSAHGAEPGVLLLLGLGLGIALFHSRFGFTSAWRQLIAVDNGAGLRAHTLLLSPSRTPSCRAGTTPERVRSPSRSAGAPLPGDPSWPAVLRPAPHRGEHLAPLHRFVVVVYVLSVWHTLLYGTNVWYGEWPRTALWLLRLLVAVLLSLRLLRPARRAERLGRAGGVVAWPGWWLRASGRVAAGAVVVGLVVVAVSGRDGGRDRPARPPATAPHAQETD